MRHRTSATQTSHTAAAFVQIPLRVSSRGTNITNAASKAKKMSLGLFVFVDRGAAVSVVGRHVEELNNYNNGGRDNGAAGEGEAGHQAVWQD